MKAVPYLFLASIGGYLYGFNFFISNFLIQLHPRSLILPLAGIPLFVMQTLLFRALLTLFPATRGIPGKAGAGGTYVRIYAVSLTWYHVFLIVFNGVMLAGRWIPLLVYVNDYSILFFYGLAVSLMIRKGEQLYSRQNHAVWILLAFFLTQGVLTLILYTVKVQSAGFFR